MNDRVRLLTAKNVVKRYQMGDAEIEVLNGVDLELSAGEALPLSGALGVARAACCMRRDWTKPIPEIFKWRDNL